MGRRVAIGLVLSAIVMVLPACEGTRGPGLGDLPPADLPTDLPRVDVPEAAEDLPGEDRVPPGDEGGEDVAGCEDVVGGEDLASGEDLAGGEDVSGDEDVTPVDAADPGDPGPLDPGPSDPGPDDPAPTDPGPTDPGPTDPGPSDPGPDDPGPTDPGPTDPGPIDPGPSDPGPTDPGAVDPGSDIGDACGAPVAGRFLEPAFPGGPSPNAYAWDGSWVPQAFPPPGLFDDEYGDGHLSGGNPTPILPPGRWDWVDADNDLANWRNFQTNLGEFWRLKDGCGRHFGWRFVAKFPDATDFAGPAEYFEGSSGTDLVLLGANGGIHSIAGSLGGGPDVLVFGTSYSLDYRTGASTDANAANDDDLVIAGCAQDAGGDYPILTTSIHAGPGADVVFARNLRASAIDAGNGVGGRTDVLDVLDGDDLVVLGGNGKDVRFFGGRGDDTLAWYADEMGEKTAFQGGDFFGGGGAGNAIWGDPGTDRLVMVIPPATPLVKVPQDPATRGFLLVMRENASGCLADPDVTCDPVWDPPTVNDPYAKYCITCGKGPEGQRTLFVQYRSANGFVDTGYVSVTAFEELQVGSGAGAKLYRLDPATGVAALAPDLAPIVVPPFPLEWCAMR